MEKSENAKTLVPKEKKNIEGQSIFKKERNNQKNNNAKKVQFKEHYVNVIIVENWKKLNALEDDNPPMCNCNLL